MMFLIVLCYIVLWFMSFNAVVWQFVICFVTVVLCCFWDVSGCCFLDVVVVVGIGCAMVVILLGLVGAARFPDFRV